MASTVSPRCSSSRRNEEVLSNWAYRFEESTEAGRELRDRVLRTWQPPPMGRDSDGITVTGCSAAAGTLFRRLTTQSGRLGFASCKGGWTGAVVHPLSLISSGAYRTGRGKKLSRTHVLRF